MSKRLSKKEREAQRLCFEQDDDGHWYCIPLNLKQTFTDFLLGPIPELGDPQEFEDAFIDKFSQYRLPGGPTHFSFTDLREIEF